MLIISYFKYYIHITITSELLCPRDWLHNGRRRPAVPPLWYGTCSRHIRGGVQTVTQSQILPRHLTVANTLRRRSHSACNNLIASYGFRERKMMQCYAPAEVAANVDLLSRSFLHSSPPPIHLHLDVFGALCNFFIYLFTCWAHSCSVLLTMQTICLFRFKK